MNTRIKQFCKVKPLLSKARAVCFIFSAFLLLFISLATIAEETVDFSQRFYATGDMISITDPLDSKPIKLECEREEIDWKPDLKSKLGKEMVFGQGDYKYVIIAETSQRIHLTE